jgi:hypothetical protein
LNVWAVVILFPFCYATTGLELAAPIHQHQDHARS